MRYGKWLLLSLYVLSLFFGGCRQAPISKEQEKTPYDRPLAPGANALVKITDPMMIPDFSLGATNVSRLKGAIEKSLNYMSKPSSKWSFPKSDITHERCLASLKRFGELLDSGLKGVALNAAIQREFDVYMSVGCDDRGTVLFTGYYTPIFDGAMERTGRFQYPLYKQPDDLIKGENGVILGRRMSDGSIVKYPARGTIEGTGMLRGKELIWLGDEFEAYVVNVQGSAKIRMPDGKLVGVGYAGNNGWDYKSIGKMMVAEGVLTDRQLSLSAMLNFFKQNKNLVRQYTSKNPRYVFFRFEEGPARGSLNEPVTPMRTIATDKDIFPRAALTYIKTSLPAENMGVINEQYFEGFFLDQDTGGAIRAPGRCDVYIGEGDKAGLLAGQTYQEGKLYYLFLKDNTINVQY